MSIVIKPACWYKSQPQTDKELFKHWLDGKDFKIIDGPYCSICDYHKMKAQFGKILLVAINQKYGDILVKIVL